MVSDQSYHVTLQDEKGAAAFERQLQLPLPLPDLAVYGDKTYVRIALADRRIVFRASSGTLALAKGAAAS